MRLNASHAISVLIAEEDANVRAGLTRLVEQEPHMEVMDAVADAGQAIVAATLGQPTVALIDMHMPGGGVTAGRGIKQCSPRTSVLTLSAASDRAWVLEMLEAGADGFLTRDASAATIVAAIKCAASVPSPASVTSELAQELGEKVYAPPAQEEHPHGREARVRGVLAGNALGAVFQPICTLAGETVGAEALARFRCEPRQSPERWLSEARAAGLGVELEIAAAQAALAALPALTEPLYLTINASPEAVLSAAFARLVEQTDAHRVVIEIAEHTPIDSYERLRTSLAPLRALGARVAMNATGADLLSLQDILHLKPEFIKLQRELVDGIETDASLQALVAGLISLAAKIGATIIAEGIESARELEALQRLGIRFGQGYLFARPAALPLQLRLPATIPAAAAPHLAAGAA